MSKKIIQKTGKKGRLPVKKQRIASPEDPEGMVWQQMHIVSKHWQSDLVFFQDELHFFGKLIDRYLMWLTDNEHIGRTRKIAVDLQRIEKKRISLLDALNEHHRRLANLIENPFSHNAQECKEEHSKIEDDLAVFVKTFRRAKREVFNVTEVVIESEKSRNLLEHLLH
jgi:hypothetical protein